MIGSIVRNGMLVPATPAAVRAAQPAGLLTYTAAADFNASVREQVFALDGVTLIYRPGDNSTRTLSLRAGQTLHMTPAFFAQLTGLGAVLNLVP